MTVIKITFVGWSREPSECIRTVYIDGCEEKKKSFVKKGHHKLLKEYFDKVTNHKCILKDEYCIYTTDPMRINEHKLTLMSYVQAICNIKITDTLKQLERLNSFKDWFEKEQNYDI